MNGETSREEKIPNPSSCTPASPPTEQPALAHLLEVAAKIVRREYLPPLESCKNIGQARTLIARYGATHAALGMELKSIFDKLASVRAASTGTGWISVEDRLPATNSAVLFWTNDGMWESGYFRLDGKIEWQCQRTGLQDEPIYFRADQVTHWMIPAPPVASQNGKEED
jgi:Protein of unknown function (DUF551)